MQCMVKLFFNVLWKEDLKFCDMLWMTYSGFACLACIVFSSGKFYDCYLDQYWACKYVKRLLEMVDSEIVCADDVALFTMVQRLLQCSGI